MSQLDRLTLKKSDSSQTLFYRGSLKESDSLFRLHIQRIKHSKYIILNDIYINSYLIIIRGLTFLSFWGFKKEKNKKPQKIRFFRLRPFLGLKLLIISTCRSLTSFSDSFRPFRLHGG